jgi:hypothetical protein
MYCLCTPGQENVETQKDERENEEENEKRHREQGMGRYRHVIDKRHGEVESKKEEK